MLSSQCSVEEAIKSTSIPNLDVMCSGPTPPNPAELLHSQRFSKILEQLKDRYQLIVFDTPPTLAVTDGVVVAKQVDGVVLVVRWRRTNRHSLEDAHRHLAHVGVRTLGVVLNDIDLTKIGYRYRYRSYDRYGLYAEKSPTDGDGDGAGPSPTSKSEVGLS